MPDFFAAAHRHLADGDYLNLAARNPNAVQLWAYAAECILKAIAYKQGHFTLGADGKPLAGFGLHINQISKSGQTLLSLYNAAQTGPDALLGPSTAFAGWTINARYEDGAQLEPMGVYLTDIGNFRSLLTAAKSKGLLL